MRFQLFQKYLLTTQKKESRLVEVAESILPSEEVIRLVEVPQGRFPKNIRADRPNDLYVTSSDLTRE
jgi:hypothetical protein